MKFKDAKVGDRVYSLVYGWGIITSTLLSPHQLLAVDFGMANPVEYSLDGSFYHYGTATPDLYWNKPTISDDPPPKRKKKVLKRQAVVYDLENQRHYLTSTLFTEKEIIDFAGHEFIKWGGESIEIEVEE